MRTNKGYICNAEIGRPGSYHLCGRKAHYKVRGRFGVSLHYCQRHAPTEAQPLAEGDYFYVKR